MVLVCYNVPQSVGIYTCLTRIIISSNIRLNKHQKMEPKYIVIGCAPSQSKPSQSSSVLLVNMSCAQLAKLSSPIRHINYVVTLAASPLTTDSVVQWKYRCLACEMTWVRSPSNAKLFFSILFNALIIHLLVLFRVSCLLFIFQVQLTKLPDAIL